MKKELHFHDVKEAPILYTCARDRNIEPGRCYGPVILDLYIIECCTKGAGSVIINDREFKFKAGEAYIVCPKQKVIYTADSVCSREGVWCSLDGIDVYKTVTALGINGEAPFLPTELFDDIRLALEQLADLKEDNDMGADMRRMGTVYSLLGTLLKGNAAKDKNTWLEKAVGFIETNYYRKLSVSDMATEVGFERCYFSSFFKAHTGMSPHAYLSQVRVRKAASLIAEDGFTVTEAAEMVGFDARNFARIFKKITGKNPSEIKKCNS